MGTDPRRPTGWSPTLWGCDRSGYGRRRRLHRLLSGPIPASSPQRALVRLGGAGRRGGAIEADEAGWAVEPLFLGFGPESGIPPPREFFHRPRLPGDSVPALFREPGRRPPGREPPRPTWRRFPCLLDHDPGRCLVVGAVPSPSGGEDVRVARSFLGRRGAPRLRVNVLSAEARRIPVPGRDRLGSRRVGETTTSNTGKRRGCMGRPWGLAWTLPRRVLDAMDPGRVVLIR